MNMSTAIKETAKRYDSFYLYSEDGILKQMNRLKAAFSSVFFLYSVKCNSSKRVLKTVFSGGFGSDAASMGEVPARAGMII